MGNTDIVLKYDKKETNEIHYEEIAEFKDSLFNNVYYAAFEQVENILNCNYQKNCDNINNANRQRINKQIDNLICFLGDRGTGKTSAMLSFMEALKDYYYIDKGSKLFYSFKLNGKNTNISFLCLDHIDASLLESGEDLFEVILTMMYHKLVDLERDNYLYKDNFDYQKKEMLRKFEKTFAGIRNLKKRNATDEGFEEYGSYMSTMKSMAVSMTLKREFEVLVQLYLDLIHFKKEANVSAGWENGRKPYLVITIDDMDLNIESGYEMLEQIHRYLMIPQVIVLLAIDDIQMREICERHFWGLYRQNPNTLRMEEWQERVQSTARQYMNKVLPIYRRIYMPRLQDMKGIVQIKQNDGLQDSIKKFLLHKIARKVSVCFDLCGKKQHFYEPKDIRGIISLCQALDYLEDLNGNDSELLNKFEKNYAWLASDIYRRMVGEQLFGENFHAFQWIREHVPATRGKAAWQKIVQLIKEDDNQNEGIMDFLYLDTEYAYGELLRALYIYGRIMQTNKSLVRCLLASFSVIYTKQYMLLVHGNMKSENIKNAKSNLQSLLGKSVTGSWTNEMLPGFVLSDNEIINKLFYRVGNINQVNVNNLYIYQLQNEWLEKEKISDSIKNRSELSMDWLSDIELLLMFFGNYRDELGNSIKCSLTIPSESIDNVDFYKRLKKDPSVIQPISEVGVKLTGRADFNLFGFVNSLYQWDEFFDMVKQAVLQMLVQYYNIKDKEDEAYLEECISKQSLKEKYCEWYQKYHGFALPFYNLDLTYNVLKHAMYKFRETQEQIVGKENIIEKINEMYKRVSEQLKEEDKQYKEAKDEKYGIGIWQNAFEESPFVNEFFIRFTNSDEFMETFQKMLEEMCAMNSNRAQTVTEDALSVTDMTILV